MFIKNKIISLFIIFIISFFIFNIKSLANTEPELGITSNDYTIGENMKYGEATNIRVNETLQLYAIIIHRNDICPIDSDIECGTFVDETDLENVTWTSSDTEVATVDNTGKVTGLSVGTSTITAKYNNETANFEIKVNSNDVSIGSNIGIVPQILEPGPSMLLNSEDKFELRFLEMSYNENVRFKIENEDIAKITKIEYDENSSTIIVTVKYLSVGKTKLTATLNLDGNRYTDSYDLDVLEFNDYLELSARDYNDLPSSVKVGEKIQLIATDVPIRGSRVRQDVTNDVIWSSSDETIAYVDNDGLVNAIGEGNATITAKYEVYEGKLITSTYNFEVKNNELQIKFWYNELEYSLLVNTEEQYRIKLINIPNSERDNVEFKIEDENIAKITKIENDDDPSWINITLKYLSVGKTKLIATLNYNGETYTDSYNINVNNRIMFSHNVPELPMIINTENEFRIKLLDIPSSEKENIQFKIEDENIAKITKIEYDSFTSDATVIVKFLSVGKTKLTATLNYNGETYIESYDIDVTAPSTTEPPQNPKTGLKDTFIILTIIGSLSLIGYLGSKNKFYLKKI